MFCLQAISICGFSQVLFTPRDNVRAQLIAFIKEHRISGVMFISGDRHHGELMRINEPGLYPLYDFTTSPLSMYPIRLSKNNSEYVNPYKLEGTYYPSYNYGKISISGAKDNRKCRIELKDNKGRTIWIREIYANELQIRGI